ncbi:MAG: PilZ domain-containing protein [Hyphomicrobiaceae bacterium]
MPELVDGADIQRRRHPRLPLFRAATLQSLAGSETRICIVTNLSSSGSGLLVHEPVPDGEQFELWVPSLNLCRRCTIRWSHDNRAGAEFIVDTTVPS